MTTTAPTYAPEADSTHPVPLTDSSRWRILGYLSVLIFLMGFGGPYLALIDVPVSFFLKNKLHLAAHQVATFKLIAAIPIYVSFMFGFARDRWNAFGMGDRGLIILFGAITSVGYAVLAFMPATYTTLLIGVVVLTLTYLFAVAAWKGLTSTIGQQHVMSGQVSAVWNVVDSLPLLFAYLLGGVLSDQLEGQNAEMAARILFLIGAAVMACVVLYGLWRPKIVYDNLHSERNPESHLLADVKRLARHWPIYPALTIWLLWQFAPGSVTPLQYYLQNTLHASDAQWGEWNAIFVTAFLPTFTLFGLLCRRFPLRTLLWWGTVVAVPQFIPLLFIHTVNQALFAAALIGLMGGVATAAYLDLIIRSCPKGLQGTILMASTALYWISSRFGDVLGANLYERYGGFKACVIAITVVYALILPTLLLVPRRLIDTADGQAPEGGFA